MAGLGRGREATMPAWMAQGSIAPGAPVRPQPQQQQPQQQFELPLPMPEAPENTSEAVASASGTSHFGGGAHSTPPSQPETFSPLQPAAVAAQPIPEPEDTMSKALPLAVPDTAASVQVQQSPAGGRVPQPEVQPRGTRSLPSAAARSQQLHDSSAVPIGAFASQPAVTWLPAVASPSAPAPAKVQPPPSATPVVAAAPVAQSQRASQPSSSATYRQPAPNSSSGVTHKAVSDDPLSPSRPELPEIAPVSQSVARPIQPPSPLPTLGARASSPVPSQPPPASESGSDEGNSDYGPLGPLG
mmetsp:Transcript_18067/g.54387  ORF Transcript_18067/g.54387 Transcript_18067/m.54387 type:complete len:300 (-) Transcript_18067:318-1217(-)